MVNLKFNNIDSSKVTIKITNAKGKNVRIVIPSKNFCHYLVNISENTKLKFIYSMVRKARNIHLEVFSKSLLIL